jgi:hypothetical protein
LVQGTRHLEHRTEGIRLYRENKYKRREALPKGIRPYADDLAFAQQEYDEEMAERTASARAAMERVGPIPRQQRGDGYYAIHPVYGTVQHGAGLKESAACPVAALLCKRAYGRMPFYSAVVFSHPPRS